MKDYWSISGPDGNECRECAAFYKYDGSNIRAEWSRKTGWYKFGSRSVLIDKTSPLGDSIELFLNTYGDSLAKVFTDNPLYRKVQSVVAFCEYFGEGSFAGQHDPNDRKQVVLIDVNLHKRGIVPPFEFIANFEQVGIAKVLYKGVWTDGLTMAVRDRIGDFSQLEEGVVLKGTIDGRSVQHSLWMVKVKTKFWLEKLTTKAATDARFKAALADNLKEQKYA